MAKTKIASETIESKNKAFVLEAFDTLFNSVTTRLRSAYVTELHSAQRTHSTKS
jgi:hypothetical protein